MAKDLQDKLSQAKAYCNLGLAHKALGEYNKAEECQRYLLSLAQALDNTQVSHCCCLLPVNTKHSLLVEVAENIRICIQAVFRAFGNLGDVCVCRGDLPGAVRFYQQQLTLAQKVNDQKMEADAYSALGSVHRWPPKTVRSSQSSSSSHPLFLFPSAGSFASSTQPCPSTARS